MLVESIGEGLSNFHPEISGPARPGKFRRIPLSSTLILRAHRWTDPGLAFRSALAIQWGDAGRGAAVPRAVVNGGWAFWIFRKNITIERSASFWAGLAT